MVDKENKDEENASQWGNLIEQFYINAMIDGAQIHGQWFI